MSTPRTEQRHTFQPAVRLSLVEGDLDTHDDRFDKIEARLGKIMATCLSILVALVVASLLLVLNLTAKG